MSDDVMKVTDGELHEETLEIMPLVDILINIEVKEGVMTMTADSSLRRDGKKLVFKRVFQLADSVDVEKITAKTQDGVLTLNIPKSESARVHKIKVC